jgi:hypothetical protein
MGNGYAQDFQYEDKNLFNKTESGDHRIFYSKNGKPL